VIAGSGSISGNVLSFTQAGNITVEAYQAGNDKYNAAPSVTKTITVTDDNTTFVPNISKQVTFSVYPNPSDGIINIKTDFLTDNSVLKVFSAKGVLVGEYKLSRQEQIDLSKFKPGIYLLVVKTKGISYSSTLILK
jgi:hypothetical protein